jgi:SP family sugar:H+ symporter-like MFS transporter
MNVVIAFVAPIVQASIGTKITFVWAGFIAATAVFVFFCVPETAGLKIEEIDAMFLSRTPAWKSRHFKASQHDEEELQAEKRTNRHNEKVRNADAPNSPTSSEA